MNVNHQRKVAELVDSFSAILKIECEKLYRSNMVEVESFSPDEYILAKILVSAAIEREGKGYYPRDKKQIKEVKNLVLR